MRGSVVGTPAAVTHSPRGPPAAIDAAKVPVGIGHILRNSGSQLSRRSSKDPAVGGFCARAFLISAISLFTVFPLGRRQHASSCSGRMRSFPRFRASYHMKQQLTRPEERALARVAKDGHKPVVAAAILRDGASRLLRMQSWGLSSIRPYDWLYGIHLLLGAYGGWVWGSRANLQQRSFAGSQRIGYGRSARRCRNENTTAWRA